MPLLLCASAPLFAGISPEDVRAQVVSSLSVTGTIEIDGKGVVQRYAIQHAEAFDPAVRAMLERTIPRWNFKPVLVDGAPAAARFDMYLRLQATPLDGDKYQVEVASAAFGREEAPGAPRSPGEVSSRKMTPPKYPFEEMRLGVGGKVVLVVKVGRSGKVEDVVVEQTNLKAVGRTAAMARWRNALEHEALAAAKRWTFNPPTTGQLAAEPFWSARIPVVYVPAGARAMPAPGEWESFVPGERHEVPWVPKEERKQIAESGVDALPGGRIFPLHQELELLTPLNAG
jgi:TonB family protein